MRHKALILPAGALLIRKNGVARASATATVSRQALPASLRPADGLMRNPRA